MDKKTLGDLDVTGKTILVRADFNVPIAEENPEITADHDHRLRATLPTLRYLIDRNCKLVLCSHLGRPKGRVVESLRMTPVAQRLSHLLSQPVQALRDCIGPNVAARVSNMKPGETVLLENLRFHPGEEANDAKFAEALSSLADAFVLDAFGAAHRAHASIVGPPRRVPSAAGLLLQREVEVLGQALESPLRPLATILGGAKVSDKLRLIENLIKRADALFIGGGMAATFLKAQGKPVGSSLVEDDLLEYATAMLAKSTVPIYLPTDVIVSSQFSDNPPWVSATSVHEIPKDTYIMDIGPLTVRDFSARLSTFKTIIWNGPMGVFEYPRFAVATKSIAQDLALLDATTIIGGGSTAEAIESLGLSHQMTHVSSGGGAMIEFLEGKNLPGISALPSRTLLVR